MTRRRRLALGVVMAAALAGCGQQSSPARSDVARYISQVNRVEAALSVPTATVTRVSAQISGRHRAGLTAAAAAGLARQLSGALSQIRTEDARLHHLAAPPTAAHLRSLLLQYTATEAGLTRQLDLLVGFLPRFAATVAPVGPALQRLEAALSVRSAAGAGAVAAVYADKVSALRRFQSEVGHILGGLRSLTPPAVSAPTDRAEIASLQGMSNSAGQLANALAGGAPGNVTPILNRFDRAALATRSTGVQKAQTRAIHAYDRQTARLATLAAQISRERLRLAATVH